MRKAATWGLFLAWLANDIEEWFTMSRWSKKNAENHRGRGLPGPAWLGQEMTPIQSRTAISMMGLLILAASARGARTGGESPFFQSALVGFGAHGVGHLALSAAYRGYTPGVLTAPAVVIPYSWWAWRELGRAGVPRNTARAWLGSAVLLPASLVTAHYLAHLLTDRSRPTTRGDS